MVTRTGSWAIISQPRLRNKEMELDVERSINFENSSPLKCIFQKSSTSKIFITSPNSTIVIQCPNAEMDGEHFPSKLPHTYTYTGQELLWDYMTKLWVLRYTKYDTCKLKNQVNTDNGEMTMQLEIQSQLIIIQ